MPNICGYHQLSMAAPLYNCNWTGLLEKEQIPANNPNQQTNKQNLDVNNSCTTKDLAWQHLQCFAFSDVFVPVTILFKFKMNNILIILFHCSRPFQRYQIWYDNNYLNLTNSQARLLEGVVLVALHRATSRDVARRRVTSHF